MSIRANTDSFIKQDKDLAEKYKQYGINLSQGEAALLSGFNGAFQARDMQKDKENWVWINDSIEKSKEVVYNFPSSEKPILWKDVSSKMKQYEETKRLEEIRKN